MNQHSMVSARCGALVLVPALFLVWLPLSPSVAASGLTSASPQLILNSTTPGDLESESTFHCIGFKWFIDGDDNLDCSVSVEFREEGSPTWQLAQPLLRVEPGTFNHYEIDPGNLLAGSIFGLQPDTSYEVGLRLLDPDGGEALETVFLRTRAHPCDPENPSLRYVVPGDGGGSGTQADPYQGLATADVNALPGDIFLIAPGTYTGSIVFTASGTPENPIVWRGQDRDGVMLDGEHLASSVVDVSGTSYLHMENLTIRRPAEKAVIGFETVGFVIRGCTIDVSEPSGLEQYGIDFRGPRHRDAWISGNWIEGPVHWPDGRHEDHYAVVVNGPGHVISYNAIYDWWDAILVGGTEEQIETSGCDVYGNEIYNMTDDGIETDRSRHNIRVFENRFTNVLVGLSCQPVFGGPVYLIRNVVYNWQLKPLKFHLWPTGMVVYHNTLVGADPRGWGGGEWRNTIVRNTIFVGGSDPGHGQSGEPIALKTTGVRADLDYNGWYQALPDRFAQFNDVLYPTLEDFRAGTGMEGQGLLLDIGVFVDAEEPPLGDYLGDPGFFEPYEPGSQDLRLVAGSVPIDAGVRLPNINDQYLEGGPDLGAYEHGGSVPVYGPEAAPPVGVGESALAPGAHVFLRSTPNPFRVATTLQFNLPRGQYVSLEVFDLEGRLVRGFPGRWQSAGRHTIVWDGRTKTRSQSAPGVYFVRLEAGGVIRTQKLVMAR